VYRGGRWRADDYSLTLLFSSVNNNDVRGCALNEENMKFRSSTLFISLTASTYIPFYSSGIHADELAPVIVTATRSAQSAVSTPSSINIITSADIKNSGASNLVEVLNSQASIQLNDLYGTGSRASISMRGFADNANSNVQILVDGRRLNNPDIAAADLSGISLKDVKQIEIIQGSAGVLFGDQAVGGVINIITKTPERSSSYIEAEAGSYNKRNYRASVSDQKDKLSYRLTAEKLTADNYREHNEQDYQNILGRIDYKNNNAHLFFDYQHVAEVIELPGSLTKAQMLADPRQVGSTPNDFNDSETNIFRIGVKTALNSNWNFENEITQRDSDIEGKSYGSSFTQSRDHIGVTPRFIAALPSTHGNTLVTIGIDYNQYNYDNKIIAYGIDTTAKEKTNAIYSQFVIPLSDKTTATIGGRYAKVKYNIKDATAFASGISLKDKVNVFEAGLSYQLTNKSRFFARMDENFRFAKIDENTYTSPGVIGLDTQKGQSFELGGEWKNKRSTINISAYQLKLNNEIDYDATATPPIGSFFPGANVNLEPTKRTGLIFDLKHQFTHKLTINTQYNYINGSFDGGSFDGKAIPLVSEHKLTLKAQYSLNTAWSTYAEAQYNSERYQAADYTNTNDLLPALTLLNLQLKYEKENWLASIRINNISNEKYSTYASGNGYYPSPERNVTAKVRYQF